MSTAPAPAPSPGAAPSPFAAVQTAWPWCAQLAAAFLIGAATSLLTVHGCSALRSGSRPTVLERDAVAAYRIDLNRADRAELMQLPGIGVAMVERLEDYRREHGPFRSVDELTQVRGIGPATLERMRPWVYVRPTTEPAAPTVKKPGGKKADGIKEPIDINHASREELQRLPGIGEKMSQRILDQRQKAPFKSVDELRRVPGIGPKTLERLRPYVTVSGDAVRVVMHDSPADN